MRYIWAFIFGLICFVSDSVCQDSRADLYGGYSYVNIDTNDLTSRQNANGWEASVTGNFNKWFAVEGDVSGYYKNFNALPGDVSNCVYFGVCTISIKVTDYTFAGGPRLNFKPFFIHALFGGDHLTGTASATLSGTPGSISESQDGMAGLAGGGVQWKLTGRWSLRASADYVFTRHNIFGGPSITQNNFRAGVGIVYSFGKRHEAYSVGARDEPPNRESRRETVAAPSAQPSAQQLTPPAAYPSPSPSPQAAATRMPRSKSGMNISVLSVLVAPGSNGAQIVEEAPNGVAALAGLHPGDVINAVDQKPVKTPMELAAELSDRRPGEKIRLGYLIRGMWQSEATVILQATQ